MIPNTVLKRSIEPSSFLVTLLVVAHQAISTYREDKDGEFIEYCCNLIRHRGYYYAALLITSYLKSRNKKLPNIKLEQIVYTPNNHFENEIPSLQILNVDDYIKRVSRSKDYNIKNSSFSHIKYLLNADFGFFIKLKKKPKMEPG